MIYYQDDDITIRDIKHEDIVPMFSWDIDKRVNQHDPKPMPYNSKTLLEACHRFCNRFENQIINERIEDRKYKYFIITNHEDDPIGFVNLFSIDKSKKQGEMGVIIGEKRYWRQGIGYKAVNSVVDYIFKEMDMDRLYIETGENNTPAIKLFQKLGFKKCDVYTEDEGFKFIVMEKVKK